MTQLNVIRGVVQRKCGILIQKGAPPTDRNISPERQSEPDRSQLYRVVLHRGAEAFQESRPDLLEQAKQLVSNLT